jgi:hypothetical protein
VILRAPEHRYREWLLWQHPVLMEAELDDHAKADRRLEAAVALPRPTRARGNPAARTFNLRSSVERKPLMYAENAVFWDRKMLGWGQ